MLKETSGLFKMDWGHGLKKGTFWLSTSDSKYISKNFRQKSIGLCITASETPQPLLP